MLLLRNSEKCDRLEDSSDDEASKHKNVIAQEEDEQVFASSDDKNILLSKSASTHTKKHKKNCSTCFRCEANYIMRIL